MAAFPTCAGYKGNCSYLGSSLPVEWVVYPWWKFTQYWSFQIFIFEHATSLLAETTPCPYSSHPFSMYNTGQRYFAILRYYPGRRYFGILRYYPGRGYFGISFGPALGPVLGQLRKRCVVFSLSTGFITLHNPTPALVNSLNSCFFRPACLLGFGTVR